jgi:hypothetical protein
LAELAEHVASGGSVEGEGPDDVEPSSGHTVGMVVASTVGMPMDDAGAFVKSLNWAAET